MEKSVFENKKKWIDIELIEEKDKLWDFDDSKAKKKALFVINKKITTLPFDGLFFYIKGIEYKLIGTRNIEVIRGKVKHTYTIDLIKNTSKNKIKSFFRHDLVRIINKNNE